MGKQNAISDDHGQQNFVAKEGMVTSNSHLLFSVENNKMSADISMVALCKCVVKVL